MRRSTAKRNFRLALVLVVVACVCQISYFVSVNLRSAEDVWLYAKSALGLGLVLLVGLRQDWARTIAASLFVEEAWEAAIHGGIQIYRGKNLGWADLFIAVYVIAGAVILQRQRLRDYTGQNQIVIETRLFELAKFLPTFAFLVYDLYQLVYVRILDGNSRAFTAVGPLIAAPIGIYAYWKIFLEQDFRR